MSDYIPLSYLNLRINIPQKDVRKLIFKKLDDCDREVVLCAHNSKRKPELGKILAAYCAARGYLELLKWAIENGCPLDEMTCKLAAKYGHLHILQWYIACIVPPYQRWDIWICAYAAGGGHLEVLQWARANGCPWDGWTCLYAADCGHLHILQWARANGCPWDDCICAHAQREGHNHILNWTKENGCKCGGKYH